ncbi:MAG TPA: AAA family ATPase, partial [Paludibacteraceae bacterium]|nr:AAA family ATPase [Paludibacteraceae bacterium]
MPKLKTIYVCKNCGNDSPKWFGKCSACGEWNTCVEEIEHKESKSATRITGYDFQAQKPILLHEIEISQEKRIDMCNEEVNRVLGGGLVPGSMVLIGGEPGIGKSTLVLQVALHLSNLRILYVSGEESAKQLKLRAERIASHQTDCYIVSETSLETIYKHIQTIKPELLIIDSIQTIFT